MSITKGLTYGSTEQITNTKLHNLVDLGTISLEFDEFATNVLQSIPTTAGVFKTRLFVSSLASGSLLRHDGSGGFYAST